MPFHKTFSLRRNILSCLLCCTILWNIILFCIVAFSLTNTFRQNSAFYQNELSLFCKDVEDQIYRLEALLIRSDMDLSLLDQINQESNRNAIYHQSYEFIRQFDFVREMFTLPVVFYIVPPDPSLLQVSSLTNFNAPISTSILRYLGDLSNPSEAPLQSLGIQNIDDRYYLVHYRQTGRSTIGYLISLDKLSDSFPILSTDEGIYLLDENGSFVGGNDTSIYSTKYADFTYDFENVPMTFGLAIPQQKFFNTIRYNLTFLLCGTILSILIILAAFIYMHRRVIRPIHSLQKHIEHVRGEASLDHFDYDADTVLEIKQVYQTLNQYIAQINALKIETYENQLRIQNAELQYLQLQLKPHFYLNALKNIYNLAGLQNYEQIQKLSLNLSHYLRYLFQSTNSLVPLEKEIEHVREYLALAQVGNPNLISCNINYDASLNELPVPVLIIQTFLENAVKYASSPDKELVVDIKIQTICPEEDEQLAISIYDNGPGYPEDIIASINQNKPFSVEKIGLHNLYDRLKLIYGDNAYLYLYNLEYGGTVSEILFPTNRKKKQE